MAMQAVVISYTYWLDKDQLFQEVKHRTLVDASRLARMSEADMEESKSKIEQEVMMYGTELNNTATALIDPEGRVIFAQDSSWKGHFIREILPNLNEARFHKVVQELESDFQADSSNTRFDVLVSFAFPTDSGELVSQKRGAIYIANDLTSVLTQYRNRHLLSHTPLFIVALFFATILAFWLHYRIVRPVSRVAEASKRLSQDFNVQAPETGIGEIGELASAFNATARQLAEQQKRLHLAEQVFDTATSATFVTDANTFILAVNPAFTRITGYTESDAIGNHVSLLKSDRHDKSFYQPMWNEILTNGKWCGEIDDRRKNGDIYAAWLTISSVKNAAGETTHYVATFEDLTEIRNMQQLAERLANFDTLTGLINRVKFTQTLDELLEQGRNDLQLADLLIIDIDHFRGINEALGLGSGDDLLKAVAERLMKALHEGEVLSRLGSDEFAVVTQLLGNNREVATRHSLKLAERIQLAMAEMFTLEGKQTKVGVSIGIALFPETPNQTSSEVMRQADLALHHSKLLGGNKVTLYEENMGGNLRERYEIEQDLRLAASGKQLCVYLQPQVDAKKNLVGAEALVRWLHPTRGMISPGVFIPIAESSDLIVDIDNWMLNEVCLLLARLDREGVTVHIAVNISPRHFQQSDFVDQIKQHLSYTGADPAHLVLEITEGLVIGDYSDVVAKMLLLSDIGIHFSMDDFGTGYSSLAYLKRLPIHEIKIDKSFIQDVTIDKNNAALVETILSVAKHMKLKVVAEGVETQEQADFLNAHGDVIHQGYFYGRPEPVKDWLKSWTTEKISKEFS